MNYNPYAAPQAASEPAAPTLGIGAALPWEVGEVISAAWQMFRANWAPLVLAQVLGLVVQGVPGVLPATLLATHRMFKGDPAFEAVHYTCLVVSYATQAFFFVGLTNMYIAMARGTPPQLGHLIVGGRRFFYTLLASLLWGVACILGTVALIVPGVILSCGLSCTAALVLDQDMRPVEALRASWVATRGHKWKIFLLNLVGMGILLCGFMACCVGVFAAGPIVGIATMIVYMRLTGRGGTMTSGY